MIATPIFIEKGGDISFKSPVKTNETVNTKASISEK